MKVSKLITGIGVVGHWLVHKEWLL